MKLKDFSVERYFAKYEFTTKYLLSSSDCDGYRMDYVLDLASEEEKLRWGSLQLGYTETIGSEALRCAIKKHYKHIELDEILVCSPGEANFILMNVMLDAGDHVVCMAPMYQSLYQVARDIGCRLSFWQPGYDRQGWHYDTPELEKLIKDDTKLIIINFPHNPTGFSPEIDEYLHIFEIARRKGIPVFSDEMYRFLNHGNNLALPPACDIYEDAISLWGTAKTFGLAGLRLGWLTTKNKGLLKKIESFKDYLTICNSAPSEVLATIALNNPEHFVKPNIEKIQSNIKVFENFVHRNPGLFEFYKPKSGSTAFVKLLKQEPAMIFAEKLVKETGIMTLPSETFEFGTSYIRIGFGRKNMPEALQVLQEYLNKNNFN